jgi:hypothetical protein
MVSMVDDDAFGGDCRVSGINVSFNETCLNTINVQTACEPFLHWVTSVRNQ